MKVFFDTTNSVSSNRGYGHDPPAVPRLPRAFILASPRARGEGRVRGVWRTHGNYGSKVFDPASDAVFLEVFVCDDCLLRKKQLIEEVVVRHTREVVERRTPSF